MNLVLLHIVHGNISITGWGILIGLLLLGSIAS